MKKRKLLFAMLCIASAFGMRAQTDVTSTYITDADFSSTTNWTDYSSSSYHDIGRGFIGTYGVRTAEGQAVSTVDDTHLATESCFGFECRWETSYASYNQTKASASLPAGIYTITYDVENTNSKSEAHTWNNLFYVKVGDTQYADESTEWMAKGKTSWTTHTINFTIEEATTADFMISLGYGTGSNNIGSTNTPTLHVSHLSMSYEAYIDPTAITLSNSSLDLKLTQITTPLSVSAYTPATANHNTGITWSTSAPGVATVDAAGVVTAVGTGSATITATTENDVYATCSVTVTDVTPVAVPAYSEIDAGDFFIVNVATGKYLGGANSWGTQASLIDHGIPFTIAESGEQYTFDSHTYNNSTDHFFNGTYLDQGTANLYVTSLGSGKYAISTANGSAFVTSNVNNTIVANTAANPNSPLAQWYFVSKTNRDAALAAATSAAPADATYYIKQANISRNLSAGAYNVNAWVNLSTGGEQDNKNYVAQVWNAKVNVYQDISDIPNGLYKLTMQGFSSGTDVKLYANDYEVAVIPNTTGTASCAGASAFFARKECTNTLDNINITGNSLKIGLSGDCSSSKWLCFDDFELYYYGPTVGGEATEIAMDTETPMTAGNWYYFDIPVNGLYNLETTDISDIVYTTDGTILIENESGVTENFSTGVNETLTAGRYYVKSASAQSLEVTVGAYAYEVGSPTFSTADGSYIQSGTFTVTFPDAATSDPDGVTALVASPTATVNGNTVSLVATTNGFTLDLGSLTTNTDYVISIPADVYGYSDHSMNSAISLTLHTPGAFDGTYFVRNSEGKYISRGDSYNTRAIVDEFGLPLAVATDAAGTTTFTYCDSQLKLFDAGGTNIYTDNTSNPNWNLQATTGGYYIVNANDNGSNGKTIGIVDGHLQSNDGNVVWTFEPTNEHNTYMDALKDTQAATAATAAGITASNKSELAEKLAANFDATAISITGVVGIQESYQRNATNVDGGLDVYTETVSGLTPGLYKLTVYGLYRWAWFEDVEAAGGTRSNVYLYAGDVKTQLASLFDYPANSPWNGDDDKKDASDKYYPNGQTGAGNAYDAGNYLNELYVYVSGTSLTFGIKNPNRLAGNEGNNGRGTWLSYRDFTLTRYDLKTESVTVTSAGYATFASDNALDFSSSSIKAYTASVSSGSTLEFERINKVPAGTGVLLYADGGATENIPYLDGAADATTGNVFVRGTGDAVTYDATHSYYVLANVGGVVGFYQANNNTVATNRAYINAGGSLVKSFYIDLDDDATGINSLTPALSEGEGAIYNLAGQRMNKIQKGINIVNGKKILK